MESVFLIIHLVLALAIIGLVLLQRSEGGGLGIGGNGGMGALASVHGTANILTRATGICAAGFFLTSLILGMLAGAAHHKQGSIMDALDTPAAATAPVTTEPATAEHHSTDPTPAAPEGKAEDKAANDNAKDKASKDKASKEKTKDAAPSAPPAAPISE